MARIAGVDLPKDKRIEIGLTYVYGIGRTSAKKILDMTGINPDTRVKDLTDEEEAKLREAIDHHYIVEGDLRRQTALDIKRPDRDRLLPWYAPSPRPARSRTEKQDQRSYPQGSETHHRK